MSRTRRQFLRNCAVLGAASRLARFGEMTAHAQPAGYKALVCVFLFGGNDSNNMVVPLDSRYSGYAAMRGPVALPSASLLPAGSSGFGFHPGLAGIQRLYQQRAAATVFNVGTLVQPTTKGTIDRVALPRSLQSHSDQTQQWQSADPNGGLTGWGGRVAEAIAAANTGPLGPGVIVNNDHALFLSGNTTQGLNVSNAATGGLMGFGLSSSMDTRVDSLQRLLTFDTGLQLVSAADGVLAQSIRTVQEVNAVVADAPALPVSFPSSNFGEQLAQVARLINVRGALGMNRQIFFASLNGFDHHDNLLANHAELLRDFDQGVSALFDTLEAFGVTNEVTLFTESEFNRTGDANATGGTDHAWGGHQLVIGGGVRGSLHGIFPTLQLSGPDDMNDRGTWIPTTSLDQYAATLAEWFGVDDAAINGIFPNLRNFPVRRLGFLGSLGTGLAFSDEELASGQTIVRSAHLTELRTTITMLRTRHGLATPNWTDPTLTPGVTLIKRAHLLELRTALDGVYVAAARTPPVYPDSTIRSAVTIISARQVAELRAAVRAIW